MIPKCKISWCILRITHLTDVKRGVYEVADIKSQTLNWARLKALKGFSYSWNLTALNTRLLLTLSSPEICAAEFWVSSSWKRWKLRRTPLEILDPSRNVGGLFPNFILEMLGSILHKVLGSEEYNVILERNQKNILPVKFWDVAEIVRWIREEC